MNSSILSPELVCNRIWMKRLATPLLSAVLLAASVTSSPASSQSFTADYTVTLVGLPVAKARFDSSFTANAFSIQGTMSSSGIARIFDRTTGTSRVEGAIRRGRVEPQLFTSSYKTGRKQSDTRIRYARGMVSNVENTPEPRKGENWVEVASQHLANALDPLSATLVRTSNPSEVCGRIVPFFDGELRANLHLTAKSAEGANVTCGVRFEPVSGYRKGRRQIEFMQNRSRMSITFAPLGQTGFYAPVDASVGTQVGTLRITATKVTVR